MADNGQPTAPGPIPGVQYGVNGQPVNYTTTEGGWERKQISPQERQQMGVEEGAHQGAQEAQQELVRSADAQDRAQQYQFSAQDENEAANKQRLADIAATAEKMRAIHAADREQQLQKYDKLTNPETLFAKPSTAVQIMQAIALGMSNASSTMAGGNGIGAVQQQLQHQQEMDMQQKRMLIDNAAKRYEMAGHSLEDVERWRKAQLDMAEMQRLAQDRWIMTQVGQMGSLFPQKAAEARLLAAKQDEAYQARKTDIVARDTAQSMQGKQTRVEGDKGESGRSLPAASDLEKTEMMKHMGELAKRSIWLGKNGGMPTPEMFREYEQNEARIIAQQTADEEGGTPSVWFGNMKRRLGLLPQSAYPESANAKQREYLDNYTIALHFRTKQLGEVSGLTNSIARGTIQGPAGAHGGEKTEDSARKNDELFSGFVRQGEAAEKYSKEAMRERKEGGQHPQQSAPVRSVQEFAQRKAKLPPAEQAQVEEIQRAALGTGPRAEAARGWLQRRNIHLR